MEYKPFTVFTCRCGKTFKSTSVTRARCPECGAFCRTHEVIPTDLIDPRSTLTDTQRALSAIAERALFGNATKIDVEMARVFTDAIKYLTPALEAALVEKRDVKREIIELLRDGENEETCLLE